MNNKSTPLSRSARILKHALELSGLQTDDDYTSETDIESDLNSGEPEERTRLNEYIEKWLEDTTEAQNEPIILHNLEPLCCTDQLKNFPLNTSINTDNFPIQYEYSTHIIESDLDVGRNQDESALSAYNFQQQVGYDSQQQQQQQYFNINQTRYEGKNLLGASVTISEIAADNPQQQAEDITQQQQQQFKKDQAPFEYKNLLGDSVILSAVPEDNSQQQAAVDKDLFSDSACENTNIVNVKETSKNDLSNESGISNYQNDDPDWEISKESDETDVIKKKSNLPTCAASYKKKYKNTFCIFCEQFIVSKHFSRHIQHRHKEKKIVQNLLNAQSKKEKRNIIVAIRNKGNFQLKARNGTFIPKKCMEIFKNKVNDENYSLCAICKGHFRNTYLVRHYKSCQLRDNEDIKANAKVESFLLSLQVSYQEFLRKDPLKKELLQKLRLDDIGKTVIQDPIIIEYGVQLLQTSKNLKKRVTLARNKMRECARLLIEAKKTIPLTSEDKITSILDILKCENIDYLVESVKKVSSFSESERTYGAASYALHQGKTLKDLIDIGVYLITKKDSLIDEKSLANSESLLAQLKNLRQLIETNWGRLVGSLALKDLNVKKSKNHAKRLLPLTEDLMKLRQHCIKIAENSIKVLSSETNPLQYSILVEVTFMLLLLHNRKRVGDIQFIELTDVTNKNRIDQEDEILRTLSKTEIILTKFYKKIHTIGKGSKEVLVLIPRDVQKFVDYLVLHRGKYVDSSNKYFFTKSGSDEWINGCHTQTKYSKACGAKFPHLIRSSKLRKHIATMMQLMDLRENEVGQLASFMGHTVKTHKEFYRLPKDIMMIAKVSKILLKLEKGELIDCKDKSMDEIELNISDMSESADEEELEGNISIAKTFEIPIASGHPLPEKDSSLSDEEIATSYQRPSKRPLSVSESSDTMDKKSSIKKNKISRRQSWSSDTESFNSAGKNSSNSKKNKRYLSKRQPWSSKEIELLKQNFSKYLLKESLYPTGKDIKAFIEKFLKSKRTVAQVKSKIQHLRKLMQ